MYGPLVSKTLKENYSKLHGGEEELAEVEKTYAALDKQVGGDHYKSLKIQPMEYSMANGLDACQHTAIKYITRFRTKGGLEDLDKAIHAIELLKGFEETKDETK